MPDFKRNQMRSAIQTANGFRSFVPAPSSTRLRGANVAADFVRARRSQEVKAAASDLVMAGSGDVDNRKMLTAPLDDMQAVVKVKGNAVVGSLAYSTTKDDGKEYKPDFFGGLFAPFGQYALPAGADVTPNPNVTVKPLTPTASSQSWAGDINSPVIQKTSVW